MKKGVNFTEVFVLFSMISIVFGPSLVAASEAEFYLFDASPLEIRAGESTVLNLTLKNLGTEQALRVGASLDPDDTSPIDPIGIIKTQIEEATEGYPSSSFGAVNQAEEITLSFKVTAKHNATTGTYNVPLTLEWGETEVAGGTHYQTLFIGMTVLEAPFASLSIKTIEPTVFMPGEEMTMAFTLLNEGQEEVKDIVLSWSSTDDVITPLGSSNSVYITNLTKGQELEIPVNGIVNQNATPGIHPLSISLTYYDSNENQKTSNFSSAVSILRKLEPEVDVKLSPVVLNPGEKSEVVFEITNLGTSTVRDIVVVWTAQDNAVLPLGSGNRITISSLEVDESITVPVQVVSGFEYGVYTLSLEVYYFDALDEIHENSINMGAVIGGETGFQVSLQQSSETSTSFSIGNIGVNPATSVVATIPPQEGFAVTGASESFLGNLEPGDFSVASFEIVPMGPSLGGLQIEVSYTGTDGARQTITSVVNMPGGNGSAMEFGSEGFQTGSSKNQRFQGGKNSSANNGGSNYITQGVGALAAILVIYLLWKLLGRRKK
jgi:hypothetical protein